MVLLSGHWQTEWYCCLDTKRLNRTAVWTLRDWMVMFSLKTVTLLWQYTRSAFYLAHTHTHTHTFSYYKDVSLPSCVTQRCSSVCHKEEVQLHSFTTPEFGFSQWSASRSGRFTHGEKPWYPHNMRLWGWGGGWKSAWRFWEENCCQLPITVPTVPRALMGSLDN
jgi:hypothetical protein